jgi:aromatic-L-amino-acid decarboxylase
MADLDPAEFRRLGRAVVDWVADYRAGLAELPVRPAVAPGEVRAALDKPLPEQPRPLAELLDELDRVVVPVPRTGSTRGSSATSRPNASLHSLLGDLLSGGLGSQGMLWSTGPATTELEQLLLDGLAVELGLDAGFTFGGGGGGSIQDSASSAALVALLAALHRAQPDWREHGVTGRERVYVTAETHSSLAKAVRVAGLGAKALRVVEGDPATAAMAPRALDAALTADRAAGLLPVLVCATVGTTGTGAIDPVREIAAVLDRHRADGRGPGCTWTRRGPGWPRSARSTATCSTASSGPTRSAPTRTSGCSPRSTPRCCGCAREPRCPTRCPSPRSTSATRPRSPRRSSTTGTGRSRWDGGSGR